MDFVVKKVAVGEVLLRSYWFFAVRITLPQVLYVPWTLDPQKCIFTLLLGQTKCMYVCIYGVMASGSRTLVYVNMWLMLTY